MFVYEAEHTRDAAATNEEHDVSAQTSPVPPPLPGPRLRRQVPLSGDVAQVALVALHLQKEARGAGHKLLVVCVEG